MVYRHDTTMLDIRFPPGVLLSRDDRGELLNLAQREMRLASCHAENGEYDPGPLAARLSSLLTLEGKSDSAVLRTISLLRRGAGIGLSFRQGVG